MIDDLAKDIKETSSEVKRLKKLIKELDIKISEKVESDISHYKIETDLGKREVSKVSMKDLIHLRNSYKKELKEKERELSRMEKSMRERSQKRSNTVLVRL